MLKIKKGVLTQDIKPEILLAVQVIASVFSYHNRDCVITSVSDGKHRPDSFHYKGQAIDIRTKHLSMDEKLAIIKDIKEALTADYDVVLEALSKDNEHLHVEYDKK